MFQLNVKEDNRTHQMMGGRLEGSRLILGMMRYPDLSEDKIDNILKTALGLRISCVDHADIYGAGDSEALFGRWLGKKSALRDQMVIQTKCGIRDGYYDISKTHIVKSAEDSLRRLQTESIDLYMLHRPDTFMVPEEIAEAFQILKRSGKVKHFGVSNMNPLQIERLQRVLDEPLLVNQVQFGLKHTGLIDSGFQMNTEMGGGASRTGNLLEYAQLNGITLQAWSPLQFGFFEGNFIGHPDFEVLNKELNAQGLRHGLSPEALAIAWILSHPANIQVVLGTTSPERIADIEKATRVTLD